MIATLGSKTVIILTSLFFEYLRIINYVIEIQTERTPKNPSEWILSTKHMS